MESIFNLLSIIVLCTLVIIVAVLGYQRFKDKKKLSANKTSTSEFESQPHRKAEYDIGNVQDFLDFDKIYNDMIIRDNGSKFTMIVHCSGINFDLMSDNERTMVEEAFIELLNFIQFPIQIYVQTRKVDLKDSLKTYSTKIQAIEAEIKELADEYSNLKIEEPDNVDRIGILEYEIKRKQNLYEYAADLKKHIERMSINNNVLQQRYYVIVTYHIEELGMMIKLNESEILEMAFNELYTRCHSIIGALSGCDIDSKILDSNGLAELLYMAFNRDDGELYRLKDNLEAGFYRLYSTTESAMDIQQGISSYIEDEEEDEFLLLTDGFEFNEFSKEILLESNGEKAIL